MTPMSRWRKIRTPILGLTALAMLLWMAIDQFDVPAEEMLEMMIGAFIFVALITVAALVMALLLRWLRR